MRLLPTFCAAAFAILTRAFPNAPFNTSTQWVIDSAGANFTYVGVNWPGAGEVMIPEGLQYQSISSIVAKIKELNMNVVRLTFAIEMLDDIEDNGGDVTVQNAFTKALGSENGAKVWDAVVKNNPTFTTTTTRLQVYDSIAAELAKQQIYVHLDNHISKGKWCCNGFDGNTWFGDTDFNVTKWERGLVYMAKHSKKWPNMVSLGLRNELRKPDNADNTLPYNWQTWYDRMLPAANAVHAANPDILIFLSGLDYDTTLGPLPMGDDLGDGKRFIIADIPYRNKLVLEVHNYQTTASDCSDIESGLWDNAFRATFPDAVNRMPVVLSEFGFSQADGLYQGVYATCLKSLIPKWQLGWMVWALAGSYYIRDGTQDYDETWGLTNHDWSAWRDVDSIDSLKDMVSKTFEAV